MPSAQVLDRTAVHPESYAAAEKLLTLCGYTLEDVSRGGLADLPNRLSRRGPAGRGLCGAGMLTLRDVARELLKPGRDPEKSCPPPFCAPT